MANNFIGVDRAKQQGGQLLRVVETLRSAEAELKTIKDNMDNMTDGITYITIETQFGIDASKGDEVYNLVAGAVSELAADTNLTQLIDWLGPKV